MIKYPSISVIIPTFNEEKNLKILFPSLENQTYPRKKIEYIVVDDDSKDNTVKIAKKFGAKIINVKTHDIGLNKRKGLMNAQNDLVYCMDADIEICNQDFLKNLTKPFMDDSKIVGSFTKEFALDACGEVKNSLLRFISHHPLQQDPLYEFLSPSIESTIRKNKDNYYLCEFISGKIPAVGRIMYKRKELIEIIRNNPNALMDMDLETTEIVSRSGKIYFAYVPQAKLRHHHAESLGLLVKKRIRNLKINYLPNVDRKNYLWFNPNNLGDILKLIFWVWWANLIIPETLRGVIRCLIHKDLAFIWHPVVSIVTTDALLFTFISQRSGRQFMLNLLKKLLP